MELRRDGRLLFVARAVRTFAFGWLSVILALFLAERGFSPARIGQVFTATMVEDAVLTLLLSSVASRVGPVRTMLWTAPLVALGGVLLAVAQHPWVLVAGAVLGTLSPNGQEAGPFLPMEQAQLADLVSPAARMRVFAWYNVAGFLPAALGALAAGGWLMGAHLVGLDDSRAYRGMLWVYACAGVVLTLLYARLHALRRGSVTGPPVPRPRSGPLESRRIIFELCGFQALDSLAGGFIVQSLLAYWFHVRFGVGAEAIGPLFFGANLLSALSFLAAPRIADRVGLLNTMVFTHLPSNFLLLLVPLMPSFRSAALVLLARHLLSQMDVPTRQAYTMALVTPAERPAAAGLISGSRALAQSLAPALSGLAMTAGAAGLPFFLAGGLKIVFDLSLYARFRGVPLKS